MIDADGRVLLFRFSHHNDALAGQRQAVAWRTEKLLRRQPCAVCFELYTINIKLYKYTVSLLNRIYSCLQQDIDHETYHNQPFQPPVGAQPLSRITEIGG